MTRTNHRYGWIPSRPDHRDHEFLPTVARHTLNPTVLLDVSKIPVLNQGQQGSCTGHGTAGVVMFDQQKQSEPVDVPSRAMIYYDARLPEGSTNSDSGAQVRDAVGGVAKYGVCTDQEFPYNDRVFNIAPSAANYQEAKLQEALAYEAVAYPHLNAAIASGFPFVFGFTVYESFESSQVAETGIVPVPQPGESVMGGHCVWCHGYTTSEAADWVPAGSKVCRNSWGESWGHGGDFALPQWFFDNGQASDFWVIKRIGAGA